MKFKKAILCILMLMITSWCSQAELLSQSDFPFRAEAVYPDNQLEADAGYFFITAQEGAEQTLTVRIANTGALTQQIGVESASCYTSPYGDLVFVSGNKSPLMGLEDDPYRLESQILLPEVRFDLKAGQSRDYSFPVRAPEKASGEVLGAVRFSVTQRSSASGKGFNLNVRRAVTIIIRLRMGTEARKTSPSILLDKAGWMKEENRLYITLINQWTAINRQARGMLRLRDEKGKLLVQQRFDLIKMAPRSFVCMPVDVGNIRLKEGFTAEVQLDEAGSPIQKSGIVLEDILDIPDETSAPQAPPNLEDTESGSWLLTYGGWLLFGVSLLFILLYFLLFRRRKRDS